MATYWNETYKNAPENAKVHVYYGNDVTNNLLKSYVEYEMDAFFSEGKVKEFALMRLEEIKNKILQDLNINLEQLDKMVVNFLTTNKGVLPEQTNHYGDWKKQNNVWVKQNGKSLLQEREVNIKYYNKYIKYKNKYIALK